MYIALEGIKGSGKTTVHGRACQALSARDIAFASLRTTCRAEGFSLVETLYECTNKWWPDWAVARVYATRSNRNARAVPRRTPLILGDRSLLTSYVTRWDTVNPELGMQRVEAMETLRLPDHVIYLNLPVDLAQARINNRERRNYGHRDQARDRLSGADSCYKAIAREGRKYGLGGIRWHWIDAAQPLDGVIQNVLGTVASIAGIDLTDS